MTKEIKFSRELGSDLSTLLKNYFYVIVLIFGTLLMLSVITISLEYELNFTDIILKEQTFYFLINIYLYHFFKFSNKEFFKYVLFFSFVVTDSWLSIYFPVSFDLFYFFALFQIGNFIHDFKKLERFAYLISYFSIKNLSLFFIQQDLQTRMNTLVIQIFTSVSVFYAIKLKIFILNHIKILELEINDKHCHIQHKQELFFNFPQGVLVAKLSRKEEEPVFYLYHANKLAEELIKINMNMCQEELKDVLSSFHFYQVEERSSFNVKYKRTEKDGPKSNLYLDIIKQVDPLSCQLNNIKCEKYKNSHRTIQVRFSYYEEPNSEFYYKILCFENFSDERKQIQKTLYNNIKSQFLLTISHELNNPLNGLLFACEKLIEQNKENDEKTEKLVEKIKRFKFYIKFFIKNLTLSFKIILKEKLKSKPINLNLFQILNSTLTKFQTFFESKKIKCLSDLKSSMNVVLFYDYEYFKFLLKNIFMYVAYRVDNSGRFIIQSQIDSDCKTIKIILKKYVNTFNQIRENLLTYSSYNEKEKPQERSFSDDISMSIENSVQTKEMLQEIIHNLSIYLNIKIEFHPQSPEELYVTMIMDIKEICTPNNSSDILELSPGSKDRKQENIEILGRSINCYYSEEEQSKLFLENFANFIESSQNYKRIMKNRGNTINSPLTNSLDFRAFKKHMLSQCDILHSVTNTEEKKRLSTPFNTIERRKGSMFYKNTVSSTKGVGLNVIDEDGIGRITTFKHKSSSKNIKSSESIPNMGPFFNERGFSVEVPKVVNSSNDVLIQREVTPDFRKDPSFSYSGGFFNKPQAYTQGDFFLKNMNINMNINKNNLSNKNTTTLLLPIEENIAKNEAQIHQHQNVFNFNIDFNLNSDGGLINNRKNSYQQNVSKITEEKELAHFDLEESFVFSPNNMNLVRSNSTLEIDPLNVKNNPKLKFNRVNSKTYKQEENEESPQIILNPLNRNIHNDIKYDQNIDLIQNKKFFPPKHSTSSNHFGLFTQNYNTPNNNKPKDKSSSLKKKKHTTASFSIPKEFRKPKKPKTLGENKELFNPIMTPNFHVNTNMKCDCKKILIVDDEQFNINTLKFVLKNFKIAADFCYNGQEALEKITNSFQKSCCNIQYKLVFMDVMMPVMDGIEASNKVQELYDRNLIKAILNIVIISAHDLEAISDRVKNIKMVKEFVSKPVKKSKIEELLNKYYFDI
jgi:CheY-like chemotaxis protein